MRRDLDTLASKPFDVLVIGGGILGACVAWDAALRGLGVALVERGDFASGTSSNSLKIVHGGLRYLQHLDFRRMRESIRERSAWLRIASHLVEPLPILVPTQKKTLQARPLLRAALVLNDAVGWDRNRGLPSNRRLPPGRAISRRECLELVPELKGPALTGGVLFHDARMYSSERLLLEVLDAACAAGATVANYVECERRLSEEAHFTITEARDAISGARVPIRSRVVVNTAGPATPVIAGRLIGRPGAIVKYSVALNLVVRSLGHRTAFAISGTSRDPDAVVGLSKRQLFIVPWRDRSLIGTGHYSYEGDSGRFVLDEGYVATFLREVNAAWPGEPFRRDDVLLVHAGLLPIAAGPDRSGVRLLKRHQIIDHARDGAPRVISAVSVKYTTARLLAEGVVDLTFRKLGRKPPRCSTATTPLPGASGGPPEALTAEAHRLYGNVVDDEILDHLVHTYGVRYKRILAYRNSVPDWDERVVRDVPVIKAQFAHGVREEMALAPDDLLCRRTELGARGTVSDGLVRCAAQVLAAELGCEATLEDQTAHPSRQS